MPVHKLAPALLALGDLLEEGSSILNPGIPPVTLDVQAVGTGSFHVALLLSQTSEETVNLPAPQGMTALSNLIALVTGSRGVLNFMRAKFAREETAREILPQGRVRVDFNDGTSAEATTTAIDMASDLKNRRTIRSVVNPLAEVGVEEIVISTTANDEPDFVITETDVPVYLDPELAELAAVPPDPEIRTLDLCVDKPDLNNRNGSWLFSSAIGRFCARIRDEDFLDRVAANEETFGAGHLLHCEVQFEQIVDRSGQLRPHVEVLRVISHQPPLEHYQGRFDA